MSLAISLERPLVINNVFNLTVYVAFISVGTMIAPLLSWRMIMKGIEAVKKYGWGKLPMHFVDPDYGSSALELILGGLILIALYIFLMYDFFSRRLSEIVEYLS